MVAGLDFLNVLKENPTCLKNDWSLIEMIYIYNMIKALFQEQGELNKRFAGTCTILDIFKVEGNVCGELFPSRERENISHLWEKENIIDSIIPLSQGIPSLKLTSRT